MRRSAASVNAPFSYSLGLAMVTPEARHKQGIQKMEVYDQPVNGRARKKK